MAYPYRTLPLAQFLDRLIDERNGRVKEKVCFVLGAGASVSSGIPSGQQLVRQWERELMKGDPEGHQKWKTEQNITPENMTRFYSEYYERRFFNQTLEGYEYLSDQMNKAHPSVGYAILAFFLMRTANAEAKKREAVRPDPDNALYHKNLGVTLYEMGHTENALQEVQKAIQLDPQNAQYHFDLGFLLDELNRPDEAKTEFQIARDLDPDIFK